jgi:hypothetical protein
MIIEVILIGTFLTAVMLFVLAMVEVRHRMAERRAERHATIEWLGNARRAFITGPHPRHNIPTVHISDTGRATYYDPAEDTVDLVGEVERDADDPHLGA